MINIILAIVIVIIGGILWRMGGSNYFPSWVRKTGIATIFSLYSLVILGFSWLALLLAIVIFGVTFGLLSFGYGVNSILGQFYSLVSNLKMKDILIRGTYGLIISLVYLIPIIYLGNYWKILLCLIPTILMPVIRISGIDQLNPHIEEFLMGVVYTLGFVLIGV